MTVDEFWHSLQRDSLFTCWIWPRAKNGDGYGNVTIEGRLWGAHRLAWTLSVGQIPHGLYVLHHCDNPSCCNPAHLYLGTHIDNMIDRSKRGSHPRLTQAMVRAIRADYQNGIKVTAIARKYHVGQPLISLTVHRRIHRYI